MSCLSAVPAPYTPIAVSGKWKLSLSVGNVGNIGQLTILIAMASETGHYTGTFRLARALRARGYRVAYIGIMDFQQLVCSQGFEFIPFASDLLPLGYVSKLASSLSHARKGAWGRLQKRWADERFFDEYLRRIDSGALDQCLLSGQPDLLLCDTLLWYVAIRALRLGIPTVNISTLLSLYDNEHIPPIVSSLYPGQTWWYRLQVIGAWKWLRFKYLFTKRLASILFGAYRFPTRMHHLTDVFVRTARRAGYRCKENETYWFGEVGPRLILPEIVLCPKSFQLPACPEDGRRYLGDSVDAERCEEPLPANALDPQKPLILCSLGSSAFFYPHSRRFFQAVIAASKLKSEWQFVLHLGSDGEPERFGQPEANLLICKQVPQLALLRRAAVMVTHGGINSIMECINFQVPMVVIPGLRDQPGNTTRAVYHGLALTASMARITPELLVSLIGRAMEDTTLRQGLARIKQEIARERGMENSISFIEKLISSRSAERS